MVLEYLATELGDLWGKCWYIHIPAPWSIWIYLGWFPNPIAIISIHSWRTPSDVFSISVDGRDATPFMLGL